MSQCNSVTKIYVWASRFDANLLYLNSRDFSAAQTEKIKFELMIQYLVSKGVKH